MWRRPMASVPPLGLFRSSLPPGDGELGDSEQCTELGLEIAEPFADSSDVLWLHDPSSNTVRPPEPGPFYGRR
jgi:hypothetical protein